MGTGKTKVLIDNLAMLYDKGKIDGAIIRAPSILPLSYNIARLSINTLWRWVQVKQKY